MPHWVQVPAYEGTQQRWPQTILRKHIRATRLSVVFAVYVLITAVSVIGLGFQAATGGQAEGIFSFAENPFVGLVIGILESVGTWFAELTTDTDGGVVTTGFTAFGDAVSAVTDPGAENLPRAFFYPLDQDGSDESVQCLQERVTGPGTG